VGVEVTFSEMNLEYCIKYMYHSFRIARDTHCLYKSIALKL